MRATRTHIGHRSIALLAAVVAAAYAIVAFTVAAPDAHAQQSTVPSNAASSWQTNGTVWAIASAGNVVYIGGDFTRVRPPGAAPGTQETVRNHLAAFNATTGALITSFNHDVNSTVRALAASPDGQTVYAGGDFTSIDGSTRNRVAAFTQSSGALTSWSPSVSSRVTSLSIGDSAVYVGGGFSSAGGKSVQRVAALSRTSNSAISTFNAGVDNYVYAVALSADQSKLYIGGTFTSVNGDFSYYAAAAVDAQTGATLSLSADSVMPRPSGACLSVIKAIVTDANGAYFAAEGTGGGCFDGTFGANNDGSLKWQSLCLGATQGMAVIGGSLYTGSHSHDCSGDMANDPNAFPEVGWSKGLARYLLTRNTSDGKMGNWFPNTNGGTGLGPRVLATDGTQLFVGGEFTYVNGQPQQGFVRFSPSTGDLAAPATPSAPTAVARADGKISVYVQAPLDTDDTDLTIRLYRDNGTTPIATKPVHSIFWNQPIVGFTDDGLALGSSHTYRADAVEANGPNASSRSGASNTVTVTTAVSAYESAVTAADPSLYWRLNDTHAPAVADSSGNNAPATTFGSVSVNQAGAIPGDNAFAFDGVTASVDSSDRVSSPSTFTVSAWFQTTSTSGGKIIGFGDRQKGWDFGGNAAVSGSYDKHIYMTNDGRLIFGVYNGSFDILTSAAGFNDGQWHQVVGTQGPTGMAFYVDGVRVGRNGVTTNQNYDGYWKVGGDNLGAWPSQPSSNFFNGSIDEVAVYDHALTLTQVRDQWVAAGRTAPPSNLPTDAYGKAVTDDQASTYWRGDETTGVTAVDSSENGNSGTYGGGVVQGGASAIGTFGHSVSFDGVDDTLASNNSTSGPAVYSEELWFKTATTSGGKLIGFGNSNSGMSSNYDRHVYMTNGGQLIFGVWTGGASTVTSPLAYNDNAWHYLVVTQDGSGMRMYVDGQLVGANTVTASQGYTGYWRVGGDNLNGWPSQPASAYFAGSIDEVATYEGIALSPARISAHYEAAGHTGPDIVAPTTAITSPTDGAVVATGNQTVAANADDNVGVTAVDLEVDGSVVSTVSSAPYSFTWNVTEGSHVLRTIAHDAAGNSGASAAITVTGVAPDVTAPTTAITSPADGATAYGPTTVNADANDNVGVTSVELQVDGTTVATSSTAPYTFTWNATDEGPHTLRTVAKDAAGNTGVSVEITVTVPADTTAPGAPGTLSATTPNTTTVELAWSAATDDRGVAGYRVVRDGTELAGTVTGLTYTDSGLVEGSSHTYAVRAVDGAGNVGPDSNVESVTLPVTNPVVFGEDFTGPDGGSWGSAWTPATSNGSVTTQGNAGVLSVQDVASASARVELSGPAAMADSELLMSFQWGSTTARAYFSVYLRGTDGWKDYYRPRTGLGLQLQSDSGTVRIQRNVDGVMSELAAVTGAQQVTTAKQWLRVRIVGDTIQFKIWTDGQTEPTAWEGSAVDSTVTAAGTVFISLNRSGANSGVKTVTLDDVEITQ